MSKSRFIRIPAVIIVIAALLSVLPFASAAEAEYNPSQSYKNSKYYTAYKNVKLTGDQAQDVANIAKSQIGYHESSSSYDLSGYSSGSGNCTEYSRWYGNQGSYWCNIFVSWCGFAAGVSPSVFPKLTSVGYSYYNIMPAAGAECFRFSHGSELQPGDIIFCCTCSGGYGCMDHVGLVVDVDSDYIYTAEGNMSNQVSAVKYPVSSGYSSHFRSRINYVARPDYSIKTADISEIKKADAVTVKNGVLYARYDTCLSAEDALKFCKIIGAKPADVSSAKAKKICAKLASGGDYERYFVSSSKGKKADSYIDADKNVTSASGRKRAAGLIVSVNIKSFKPVNTASFGGKKYEIYDNAVCYEFAREYAKTLGGSILSTASENDIKLVSLLLKERDAYYLKQNGKLFTLSNDGKGELEKAANIMNGKKCGFIVVYDEEAKVTVTYDANGGENTPIESVVKKGETVAITETEPVRENRTFIGWAFDEKAKTPVFEKGDKVSAGSSMTLYAVWKK